MTSTAMTVWWTRPTNNESNEEVVDMPDDNDSDYDAGYDDPGYDDPGGGSDYA